MKKHIIFINFLARIMYNFRETDIFTRSGSLAFTIVLSFVPFTISIINLTSYLPISSKYITKIQNYFFANYAPPITQKQFYHQIGIFIHHSNKLSILGFIFLLYTTYLMIYSIEKQLNVIWHNNNGRSFTKSLITYTLFLLSGPLLSAIVYMCKIYAILLFKLKIGLFIGQTISYLLTILFFALIYKMLTWHVVKWAHAFIAATVSTLVLDIIKILFVNVLIKIFANYDLIYGSLSFIPIMLIWIYVSCLNLFFCAGIIYALETRFSRKIQHRIKYYYSKIRNYKKIYSGIIHEKK